MDRPVVPRNVRIENRVFWLHSRASVFILASLSLLVTTMEWLGHAIDCTANGEPVGDAVEEYCWSRSTFTGPGKGHVRRHGHYQWVGTVLLLQSICFFAPGIVWRILEKGRVLTLVHRFGGPTTSAAGGGDVDAMVDYVLNRPGRFTGYALRFFLCEILNVLNVVGQLCFVDVFVDNYLTSQRGFDIRRLFAKRSAADPIDRVLPKIAICTFGQRTPAGPVIQMDAVCRLPVNVLNEKIILFLWFWFVLVAVVSSINVLYRMATVLSSRFRGLLLRKWAHRVWPVDVEIVASKNDMGSWFFLNLLRINLDPAVFDLMVSRLANRLDSGQNL